MDVPHTQNTAPVLEFRCLYTSDLRRKQKRWQDGRLKFHTFNRRVMVYDDRSNFVGDTHWRNDYEFAEGEELGLERGGIMVEVGECVGKRDQDLTELVDKRVKDREERIAAKNASTPLRPQPSLNPHTPACSALLRPKSLNAVLGNPNGHYGKALMPNLSLFEQRKQENRDLNESERPTKRRKQDDTPPSKSGYAQSLMGTKLSLSSSLPPTSVSIRYEPFKSSIQRPPAETIDLTGDDELTRPHQRKDEKMVAKLSRKNPHKSPPSRSGYASNLTGASLNLKTPGSMSHERPLTSLGLNRRNLYPADDAGSSSAVETDSRMGEKDLEERPKREPQKEKEPAEKKSKLCFRNSQAVFRASSPPVVSRATSFSRSTIEDKGIEASLLCRLPDQPVSALRIKSRPRKMMMLMERPISRSSAPLKSSDNIQMAPGNLQALEPVVVPQKPVLSQATLRWDSTRNLQICEKRESVAQASYSNSSRIAMDAEETVEAVGFVSSKSSNLDFPATEHDLSDPHEPTQRIVEVPKVLSTSIISSSEGRNSIGGLPQESQMLPQMQKPRSPELPQQSTISSADATSSMLSTSVESLAADNKAKRLVRKACDNSITEVTRPNLPVPVNKIHRDVEVGGLEKIPSTQELDPSQNAETSPRKTPETRNIDTTPQPPSPGPNAITGPIDSPSIDVLDRNINGHVRKILSTHDEDTSIPTLEVRPKPPSLPAHYNSAIQSVTNHFRSTIKSSASPPEQTVEQQPMPQQPAPPASIIEAQKPEPMSSEVAVKSSPKLSPPMAERLASAAPQRVEDVGATTGQAIPAVLNIGPRPQPKLINPATRGPSIQMTASRTVNALVPAFNAPAMMPPPARTFTSPGRSLALNESGDGRVKEAAKEVTPGGPWSQESYDLFGTWRPPGRDRTASTVNG
ncbi:GRF-type zinc finger domain-containing 1 [Hyphodiscus hymeniophilus]|uniref:GRF-type zinc finger domain-containing 1 n=1 Tax=Hyphodiscus hymeniophilus TaxID=353542 RepID=A0A9P6VLM4_9HELO|nr:GRF-type zinc finger domain-containing 1 [Hyphodiscus hymeniophilus]